jgi:F0F1-type ATP synthase membrane subunit b/b'
MASRTPGTGGGAGTGPAKNWTDGPHGQVQTHDHFGLPLVRTPEGEALQQVLASVGQQEEHAPAEDVGSDVPRLCTALSQTVGEICLQDTLALGALAARLGDTEARYALEAAWQVRAQRSFAVWTKLDAISREFAASLQAEAADRNALERAKLRVVEAETEYRGARQAAVLARVRWSQVTAKARELNASARSMQNTVGILPASHRRRLSEAEEQVRDEEEKSREAVTQVEDKARAREAASAASAALDKKVREDETRTATSRHRSVVTRNLVAQALQQHQHVVRRLRFHAQAVAQARARAAPVPGSVSTGPVQQEPPHALGPALPQTELERVPQAKAVSQSAAGAVQVPAAVRTDPDSCAVPAPGPVPGDEVPVQAVLVQPVQLQQVPLRPVPVQPVPVQPVPLQQVPLQPVPVQSVPVHSVPMEAVPAVQLQQVPLRPVPVQPVPLKPVPMQPVPVQSVPAHAVPMEAVPARPVQPVPVQPVPVQAKSTPARGKVGDAGRPRSSRGPAVSTRRDALVRENAQLRKDLRTCTALATALAHRARAARASTTGPGPMPGPRPRPMPEHDAAQDPGECQQAELASLRAQAVQSREDAAASVAAARQHATAQIARARQRAASKVTEAERRAATQVADAKRQAAEAEQQAAEAQQQADEARRQADEARRQAAEQAEKEVARARRQAEVEVARARQQAESEVARLHEEARTDMESMWQQVVAATQAYDEQSDELARALAGLREPGDFGTDLDTVEHETARRRLAQVELSLAAERAAWAARDAQTVLHVKQLEDALAWWDSHHAEQRTPDASLDEVESDRGNSAKSDSSNLTKSDTVNSDETEPGTSKCTSRAHEDTSRRDEGECAHDEQSTNDKDTDGRKSDCVEPATVERVWTRRTASGNEQAARTKHKYAVVPMDEPEHAGQAAQSVPSSRPRGPRPRWRPAVPDRIDEEDEEEDEDEDEGEDEDHDKDEDHQQTRERAREEAHARARARTPDNGATTALKRKR